MFRNSHDFVHSTHRAAQSFAAHQVLQYNDLLRQHQTTLENLQSLTHRLQKYQQLQPYIDTLIATNGQLKAQNENLNNQNAYLSKQIRTLHKQIKEEQQGGQRQADHLNGVIDHLKAEKRQQLSLNNALQNQLQTLEKKNKQLGTQYTVLKDKNVQLGRDIMCLRGSLEDSEVHLEKLQNFNGELAKNHQKQVQKYLLNLEEQNNQIQKMNKRIKNDSETILQMENSMEDLKTEKAIKDRQHSTLIQNHENLLKDFRVVTLKRAELEEHLLEEQDKVKRREEQLKQVQAWRNEERERYRKELQQREKNYEEELREIKNTVQNKKIKIEQLICVKEKISEDLQKKELQAASLNEEIEEYSATMQKMNNFIQELEKQCSILRLKVKELQEKQIQYKKNAQKQSLQLAVFRSEWQRNENAYKEKLLKCERDLEIVKQHLLEQRELWHSKTQEEKEKIISINHFERKQMEETYKKRILMLEAEIDCYRAKLYTVDRTPEKRAKSVRAPSKCSPTFADKNFEIEKFGRMRGKDIIFV